MKPLRVPQAARWLLGISIFLLIGLAVLEVISRPWIFPSEASRINEKKCVLRTHAIPVKPNERFISATAEWIVTQNASQIQVYSHAFSPEGNLKLSEYDQIPIVCPANASPSPNCLPSEFEGRPLAWTSSKWVWRGSDAWALLQVEWGSTKRLFPIFNRKQKVMIGAPLGFCGRYIEETPSNFGFFNDALVIRHRSQSGDRLHVYSQFPFQSGLLRESPKSADSIYELTDQGLWPVQCSNEVIENLRPTQLVFGEDYLIMHRELPTEIKTLFYRVRSADLSLSIQIFNATPLKSPHVLVNNDSRFVVAIPKESRLGKISAISLDSKTLLSSTENQIPSQDLSQPNAVESAVVLGDGSAVLTSRRSFFIGQRNYTLFTQDDGPLELGSRWLWSWRKPKLLGIKAIEKRAWSFIEQVGSRAFVIEARCSD